MAAVNTTGPAPYIYACTRMRVRKASLLPHEEYMRMLNMELPEIARFIEETNYKTEIDELASSFSGIDLMEIGLSWNLAKEYQRIIALVPGHLKAFTKSYLLKWDILNMLTILRGKNQGVSAGKIKEILIPAGSLDKDSLDKLLAEDSTDRIIDSLKGHMLYDVFEQEIAAAVESGSFSRMENELYKAYYAILIKESKSGVRGGHAFLKYVRLDIDTKNLETVFRVKGETDTESIRNLLIDGGSFSADELVRFSGMENIDEMIDSVKKRMKTGSFDAVFEAVSEKKPVQELEVGLITAKLAEMDRLSKLYPMSVAPILLYLEMKHYEVTNLRAIARGKESNLPNENIKACMVVLNGNSSSW
ncbi:V/A-type H+-transporting ATPase subunit C [Methanomicrobium sp. W14]|uniref:V-type ATP synthase subunit C n=1 Tax=Methanomicrobium sp. W14 TaxID=2817839 RepID=UPI001AE863FA|nr:V-type ATP synthase subunit C [Methanomicrobium sp. W14]MBP2133587.1 V/A-type H+-transporting ATPase subunit C [Methanomicrobium sp. W14]